MIVNAILLGLGVMKFQEMFKEYISWHQRAWFKSATTGVLAGAAAAILTTSTHLTWTDGLLLGAGTWGFASLSHAVDTCLRAVATKNKADIMQVARRRRQMP